MYRLTDGQYSQVTKYIVKNLEPITISNYPLNNVPALEMINKRKLEGKCWQSTAFLSVVFDGSDMVSRGDVTLPTYSRGDYFHSWIELTYENEDYVFDPALDYLLKKEDYYQKFNARLRHQIKIRKIRSSLIDLVDNSQEESIFIPGTNNIEDPFFRTNSQITVELENNKVKKLNVRFYSEG